jgi:hypothetical protein
MFFDFVDGVKIGHLRHEELPKNLGMGLRRLYENTEIMTDSYFIGKWGGDMPGIYWEPGRFAPMSTIRLSTILN